MTKESGKKQPLIGDEKMIKTKKIKWNESPPLKNKGIEVVVWENFTKGNEWNSQPYTRYFLVENGEQIGGFDAKGAHFSRKEIQKLLRQHKINNKNVDVYIK